MNTIMNTGVLSPTDVTIDFPSPVMLQGGKKLVGVWLPSRLVAELHTYLDKIQCDMVENGEVTNVLSSFSSSRHMYLIQHEDGTVVKVKPNRQGSSRFKLCDVQCVRKDDDIGEHVALFLWFKDFERMTRFYTPAVIRSFFNEEELALMNEATENEATVNKANGEGGKAIGEE